MTPSFRRPAWPYLAVGGICGLTWAAALRGWMEQLAIGSGGGSAFTWLTEALLLVPATLVGVLLGRAAHHRARGRPAPRALIWAPALLATAIADPSIFRALITTGEGGGSLIVVTTALCGGFTLSRRRWTVVRALAALTAASGLLLVTAIGSMAAPMQTARGAWVCLLGFSLVLLLSLASVLPYPAVHAPVAPGWYVAFGGLSGLAWAAGLRGFMADIAGNDSVVHATDTFGYLLLPGTVAGALLGWAEYLRRHGDHPRRALLALAPLTLWAVILRDLVVQPEQGVDVAPILVVLVGGAGAWAISGRGPRWTRLAGGLLFVGIWVWLATIAAARPESALNTPHGLWSYLTVVGMVALLAVAVSAALRAPRRTGSPPAQSLPHSAVSAPADHARTRQAG